MILGLRVLVFLPFNITFFVSHLKEELRFAIFNTPAGENLFLDGVINPTIYV